MGEVAPIHCKVWCPSQPESRKARASRSTRHRRPIGGIWVGGSLSRPLPVWSYRSRLGPALLSEWMSRQIYYYTAKPHANMHATGGYFGRGTSILVFPLSILGDLSRVPQGGGAVADLGGGRGGPWPPPRPPSKILLAVWSRCKWSICRIYLFQS